MATHATYKKYNEISFAHFVPKDNDIYYETCIRAAITKD